MDGDLLRISQLGVARLEFSLFQDLPAALNVTKSQPQNFLMKSFTNLSFFKIMCDVGQVTEESDNMRRKLTLDISEDDNDSLKVN